MSNIVQYDLFKTREESELDSLRLELAATKEMCHKVRKAFYASRGEIVRKQIEFDERLQIIERNICQKK